MERRKTIVVDWIDLDGGRGEEQIHNGHVTLRGCLMERRVTRVVGWIDLDAWRGEEPLHNGRVTMRGCDPMRV